MSEKRQHYAAWMRERMSAMYGDMIHHKHNKSHLVYPPHRKTLLHTPIMKQWSLKNLAKFKLKKTIKRCDTGHFH